MKRSSFTICSIGLEDIDDVIQIADECGLSPWSAEDYADEVKKNESTLVGLKTEVGDMAGFFVGRRVLSNSIEPGFDAEIYNIGVRKRFQRRGCGRMLLDAFLEKCISDSVESVWLDVRISNRRAIAFYREFGFSEFTLRKGFYSDPVEDGLVMKLTIGKKNLSLA